MPIIIDGNNLLHSLPRSARSRHDVRRLTLELVRTEGMRVTVVFDGPPPSGSPDQEHLGRATIVYGGSRSADDLIVKRLPRDNNAKNWTVVTDDRVLASRVRQTGAHLKSLREWRTKLASVKSAEKRDVSMSQNEIAEWEEYFERGGEKE
ncbi:MAG: NYN domain-containing protein [bacterium]|nr:NYN domain-containing protein [bacterium]